MSVIARDGEYGTYYGSILDSSSACTSSQMEVNANYIYKFLSSKGWSKNSIAALLGNMHAESSINPGRWQSDIVGASTMGYGLVQWTPATKYIDWATSNGFNDYSVMDANLSRIVYEVENNIQWISTSSYGLSFDEFTKSNLDVSYLAKAFLLCYERPADQSESVQEYRSSLAVDYYNILDGSPLPSPDNPNDSKKKKGYKFILFNRRRRKLQ